MRNSIYGRFLPSSREALFCQLSESQIAHESGFYLLLADTERVCAFDEFAFCSQLAFERKRTF